MLGLRGASALVLFAWAACARVPANAPGPATSPSPIRPNVILFIADDLNHDDCGFCGHPTIRTPHLDRLASESLRFDRAFVTAASCSPSRASLLTGKYPHSTGAEELHWPLPPQRTLAQALRQAGYYTAAAGKWHLGDPARAHFDLVKEADTRGFQLPTGAGAATTKMVARDDNASGCRDWVPTLRDRPRDRPFFLWLASLDPHRGYEKNIIERPHRPEDVVVPPTLPDTPEVREDLASYYDEITRLDAFVGDVLHELDRQGEADRTIVLFVSDNGRPFPRDKTSLYDGGIRTPLLVRWPGHVAPGGRSAALVSTVDLAPTLLELVGLPAVPEMQGRSFAPVLRDPAARVRDAIFAERNWHDYAARGRAVRTDRFKYIANEDHDRALTPPADGVRAPSYPAMRRLFAAGKLTPAQSTSFVAPRPAEELYDTWADPHELHDLAGDPSHARTLGDLRGKLDAWRRETGDRPSPRLSPDEFDRDTGAPLPNRVRPRLPPRP